jgi:hypothetical protein
MLTHVGSGGGGGGGGGTTGPDPLLDLLALFELDLLDLLEPDLLFLLDFFLDLLFLLDLLLPLLPEPPSIKDAVAPEISLLMVAELEVATTTPTHIPRTRARVLNLFIILSV